ncbi:MAG: nucleotidyltransferase family protein [Ruminococcus sp.]|nr:nucleotidyltransferase family protein [Ruminococcus sp.]
MNREEYVKAIKDVIYLSYCAVNSKVPAKSRTDKMDLTNVYKAAKMHLLTAICAFSLESAGITDERFTQEKAKAMRKVALMDIEMSSLFETFETEGIWYMPLKGTILKDYYPAFGMRQMSDHDILFDSSRAEDVKRIMEAQGFTTEEYLKGNHDVYHKLPVCNFEMHRSLFAEMFDTQMYGYYKNVKQRLVKDEGNSFGYHFTDEDFYVYLTAHEYKHYSQGGTGLRSVLDIYVFFKRLGGSLDLYYIESECEKLGIADFEKQSRTLALDLFGGKKLTDEDKQMLKYIVYSGAYGNIENSVKNKVRKAGNSKFRYVMTRIFPPMTLVKEYYPLFYKHRILLPVLPFYRLFKNITTRNMSVKTELKYLLKK